MTSPEPDPTGAPDDTRPVSTNGNGGPDTLPGAGPDDTRPVAAGRPLHLQFAALSDVGRVRKDNQDSGYAGPWVLTVCDGVGGAARGDIASSTAVQQLRRLDEPPSGDLLGQVAGAIHRAHDRISELVDEDPALNGTSTTLTVALFDGQQIGIGHVGDSRAYLYRSGTITQLTRDHTFVQSLIDEGRITEEDSRTHPHRNLILKAVDGVHETDPDLFTIELAPGDRLFLCSDGACGVLDDARLADILSTGTPDYAVVELVRASLEAGSSDNVTCVVADVAEGSANGDATPLLVGAAAELPRRSSGGIGSLFRGHRSGDTGEMEPVRADIPDGVGFAIPKDPIDAEQARYAPQPPKPFGWLRKLLAIGIVLGVLWVASAAAYSWTQRQYFVKDRGGVVVIYRGVDAGVPGVDLSSAYETSKVRLDLLSEHDANTVKEGIDASDLDHARRIVDGLADRQEPPTDEGDSQDGDENTDPAEPDPTDPQQTPDDTDPNEPSDSPTTTAPVAFNE